MHTPPPSMDVSWQHPTFLLPLFGLCTLLAATESLTLGLSVALIVLLVTLLTHLLMVTLIGIGNRAPTTSIWLISTSTLTALIEILLHAWNYSLYKKLGLFLPMIAVIPLLLGRKELQHHYASLNVCLIQTLRFSAGYAIAAIVLGAGRELVGHGSLFTDATQLWGPWAAPLEQQFFPATMGFMLAILAPGAFIALGLGIALYNFLQVQRRTRVKADQS